MYFSDLKYFLRASSTMCLCMFPYQEDFWVLESKILCILCRLEQTYFPRVYVYSDTEIPPPQLPQKKKCCSSMVLKST